MEGNRIEPTPDAPRNVKVVDPNEEDKEELKRIHESLNAPREETVTVLECSMCGQTLKVNGVEIHAGCFCLSQHIPKDMKVTNVSTQPPVAPAPQRSYCIRHAPFPYRGCLDCKNAEPPLYDRPSAPECECHFYMKDNDKNLTFPDCPVHRKGGSTPACERPVAKCMDCGAEIKDPILVALKHPCVDCTHKVCLKCATQPPVAPAPAKEGWEEEFDKRFKTRRWVRASVGRVGYWIYRLRANAKTEDVKSFIRSLLASREAEVRKKTIEEAVEAVRGARTEDHMLSGNERKRLKENDVVFRSGIQRGNHTALAALRGMK